MTEFTIRTFQGIPLEDGKVAVDDAGAITHYHQGIPMTAEGRVAVTIDGTVSYLGAGGAGFDDAGRMVISAEGAVPNRSLNGVGYLIDYPEATDWEQIGGGGGPTPPPSLRGQYAFIALGNGIDDARRPGLYPFDITTTPPITIPDVIDVPVATDYRSVAFSPLGDFILAGTTTGGLELLSFDGTNTSKIGDVTGRTFGVVRSIAWHPTGEYFTICHDTSPYLSTFSWDGSTATLLPDANVTPSSFNAGVTNRGASGVSYSPDGNYLAMGAGTTDPHVYFYSFSAGALTKLADPTPLPVFSTRRTAWSPDSRYCLLAANATAAPVIIYDLDSGAPVPTTIIPDVAQNAGANDGAWSPDGNYIAVVYYQDTTVRVWDISGAATLVTLPAGASGNATGVAWSPDSTRLFVTCSGGNDIYGYDFSAGPGSVTLLTLSFATTEADGLMIGPSDPFDLTI
jgi:uncharacterized protein with WD repeat